MALNERGHEVPDPTPVAMPVGFERPPSMIEMIRMHIRRELSEHAQSQGAETFEEAEDFEIEDEDIPLTRYEGDEVQEGFMPADPPPPAPETPPSISKVPPQGAQSERVASVAGGGKGGASEPPPEPQAPRPQ